MTCPICKSETVPAYRPFCSSRCADIDLGKWLTGRYAVPVEADDEWSDDDRKRDETEH
ncbi:DNA gyrase inhibitor YacG [Palleronia sp. LCG004]|uniref:DNA gyrase inhibitor YacG n=1 Tax=Palleronia sp. LCG004 TaxID=3079304 RepID=UPI0029427267|nr:DNA gyrase inhibitor YacG [Palleronia sp. LCG004]WOI56840.1 DNA gyrase inhibitor YacG [Palleronia sp. LCG004]